MTDNYQDLLLRFLRLSLGQAADIPETLSEADWKAVFDLAEKHSVIGMFLLGADAFWEQKGIAPPLAAEDWVSYQVTLEQQGQTQDACVRKLSAAFAKAGFSSSILKGQGLARLYPVPAYRQCGDIDIWVPGDRDRTLSFIRSHWKVRRPGYLHVEAAFFRDVEVEVHFTPAWLYNPFQNRRLQSYFRAQAPQQTVPRPEGFAYPEPVFNAVYNLTHIYKHVFNEGVGLRQVMDYYYVLRSLEGKKEAAWEQIRALGMGRFAAALMYVEQTFFGLEDECLLCPPDARRGRRLLRDILASGNFGIIKEDGEDQSRRWLRYLPDYPLYVLWIPLWKVWHYFWRKRKGYL